jgi:hypothetical protein
MKTEVALKYPQASAQDDWIQHTEAMEAELFRLAACYKALIEQVTEQANAPQSLKVTWAEFHGSSAKRHPGEMKQITPSA